MTDDFAGLTGPRVPSEPDATELRNEARSRFLGWLGITILGVTLAILLSGMAYTVFLIRDSQIANVTRSKATETAAVESKNAAVSAKSAADRIEDCTTQGGECYARQQENAGVFLGSVDRANKRAAALAAACADAPGQQSYAEIYKCVLAGQAR